MSKKRIEDGKANACAGALGFKMNTSGIAHIFRASSRPVWNWKQMTRAFLYALQVMKQIAHVKAHDGAAFGRSGHLMGTNLHFYISGR